MLFLQTTVRMSNITQNDTDAAILSFYDHYRPTAVMLIVLSLVGFPGNIIVLKVYWRIQHKSLIENIIFTIAIFDFMTATVGAPLSVVYFMCWFDIMDIIFCKFRTSLFFLFIVPSLYLQACVSMARYFIICKRATKRLMRVIRISCKVVVSFSFLTTVVISIFFGEHSWPEEEKHYPGYLCHIDDVYENSPWPRITYLFLILSYALSVMCLIVTNSLIIYKTRKHRKNRSVFLRSKSLAPSCNSGIKFELDLCHSVKRSVDKNETDIPGNRSDGTKSSGTLGKSASTLSSKNVSESSKKAASSIASEHETNRNFNANLERANLSVIQSCKNNNFCCSKRKCSVQQENNLKKVSVQENNLKKMDKAAAKLLLVNLCYVASYVPCIVIILWETIQKDKIEYSLYHGIAEDVYKYAYYPARYLIFMGCALNPIVYAFSDTKFTSNWHATTVTPSYSGPNTTTTQRETSVMAAV